MIFQIFKIFRSFHKNCSYQNPEGKKFCLKIFFLEATNPLLCKIFLAEKHKLSVTRNLQKYFSETMVFLAKCTLSYPSKTTFLHHNTGIMKAGGKPSTRFPPGRLVEHSLCKLSHIFFKKKVFN